MEFKKESVVPFDDSEEGVEVEDQNATSASIGPMAIITNKTMRINTLVFSINWMVISLGKSAGFTLSSKQFLSTYMVQSFKMQSDIAVYFMFSLLCAQLFIC